MKYRPVITADDVVRVGACREGVYLFMKRHGITTPCVNTDEVVSKAEGDERFHILRAACGDWRIGVGGECGGCFSEYQGPGCRYGYAYLNGDGHGYCFGCNTLSGNSYSYGYGSGIFPCSDGKGEFRPEECEEEFNCADNDDFEELP